jgi:dihydroxyacetone kinase-like protein
MEVLSGDRIAAWLERAAEVLEQEKARLTELDAAIGDSDHGENMARGFSAVRGKLAEQDRGDVGALFKAVGMILLSTIGGASGPLYGTLFLEASRRSSGASAIDLPAWTGCLEAGLEGIMRRGKGAPGDKTMIDALKPAIEALKAASGAPLAEALGRAAEAARAGAEATVPLVARKGRASYLGERSVGHQDPGATSVALLVAAAADTLA